MSVRITCINKDGGNHENSHVAISRLGWINEPSGATGTSTRLEIYDFIYNRNGVAFVRDSAGHEVPVKAAETARGTRYVRTQRDGVWTDNLLALHECP